MFMLDDISYTVIFKLTAGKTVSRVTLSKKNEPVSIRKLSFRRVTVFHLVSNFVVATKNAQIKATKYSQYSEYFTIFRLSLGFYFKTPVVSDACRNCKM